MRRRRPAPDAYLEGIMNRKVPTEKVETPESVKHVIKMWARNMKNGLETMIDDAEIDHNTTVAELLDILIQKEKTGE